MTVAGVAGVAGVVAVFCCIRLAAQTRFADASQCVFRFVCSPPLPKPAVEL